MQTKVFSLKLFLKNNIVITYEHYQVQYILIKTPRTFYVILKHSYQLY